MLLQIDRQKCLVAGRRDFAAAAATATAPHDRDTNAQDEANDEDAEHHGKYLDSRIAPAFVDVGSPNTGRCRRHRRPGRGRRRRRRYCRCALAQVSHTLFLYGFISWIF